MDYEQIRRDAKAAVDAQMEALGNEMRRAFEPYRNAPDAVRWRKRAEIDAAYSPVREVIAKRYVDMLSMLPPAPLVITREMANGLCLPIADPPRGSEAGEN